MNSLTCINCGTATIEMYYPHCRECGAIIERRRQKRRKLIELVVFAAVCLGVAWITLRTLIKGLL